MVAPLSQSRTSPNYHTWVPPMDDQKVKRGS
jgi:hypothetical protein